MNNIFVTLQWGHGDTLYTKRIAQSSCFQEDGRWMYTGGEDCTAKIWDLKMRNLSCQREYRANAIVNCVCLHPNQQELIIGDQSGIIHIWNLQNNQSEQLIPEANISIQSLAIDPQGLYLAAINNKVE